MKDFTVSVRKLTDEELLREACSMTINGTSQASLSSLYRSEHSPVRTQLYWVTLHNIPLYVATHLIRHHVGSTPFQLTCRDDRDGGNPHFIERITQLCTRINELRNLWKKGATYIAPIEEEFNAIISELVWMQENCDRYTPVNLGLCINAQSLIDIAKLRLCTGCASKETVIVFKEIKNQISQIDSDLAAMMVRKCVYRNGLCGEMRCCGFNSTPAFEVELRDYTSRFTAKQRGNQNQSITAKE